jgi:hypothetical protein
MSEMAAQADKRRKRLKETLNPSSAGAHTPGKDAKGAGKRIGRNSANIIVQAVYSGEAGIALRTLRQGSDTAATQPFPAGSPKSELQLVTLRPFPALPEPYSMGILPENCLL